ncbi:hypothetical protein [Clostridium chrysemydis]|uniref:hypothetical protein n=1 Tax=Clostridium chrysemydis TaxID=2665504 RepID=UPI0018846BD7|nr:hypothetical protein [Clostridium chrysemydis]
MKPDRKYMLKDNDDLDFIPLELNNSFVDIEYSFKNISDTLNISSFRSDDTLYSYNKKNYLREDKTNELQTDILRTIELSEAEFDQINLDDLDENRNKKNCNSHEILEKIINEEPQILNVLKAYKIPIPIAKRIINRIVNSTINYCNKDRE